MLFRPPEYLEDVRERELEIKAMEKRLGAPRPACPVCRAEVDAGLPRLPGLHDEAPAVVPNCNAPLEALWQVCPYCETPIEPTDAPVRARAEAQRPPRRRQSRSGGSR